LGLGQHLYVEDEGGGEGQADRLPGHGKGRVGVAQRLAEVDEGRAQAVAGLRLPAVRPEQRGQLVARVQPPFGGQVG